MCPVACKPSQFLPQAHLLLALEMKSCPLEHHRPEWPHAGMASGWACRNDTACLPAAGVAGAVPRVH